MSRRCEFARRSSLPRPGTRRIAASWPPAIARSGVQLVETSEAARVMEYMRKEVAIHEQLAADQPGDPEVQQELASRLQRAGPGAGRHGGSAGAQAIHRKALALREALVAADPGDPTLQRSLVTS